MKLLNLTHPLEPIDFRICDSFVSRFLGLMFRSKLNENEGIGLISRPAGIVNSSIHMFFMRFDIAVIWLDVSMCVIDKALAKKWHPYYAPGKPAMYTLELHSSRLPDFNPGDQVQYKNA
jgi:uncharacterized protein